MSVGIKVGKHIQMLFYVKDIKKGRQKKTMTCVNQKVIGHEAFERRVKLHSRK